MPVIRVVVIDLQNFDYWNVILYDGTRMTLIGRIVTDNLCFTN